MRHEALPAERIRAVETGGCPHAAIREDISLNLSELEKLSSEFGCDFLLIESGGDNLAANFSRELADYTIYIIDVWCALRSSSPPTCRQYKSPTSCKISRAFLNVDIANHSGFPIISLLCTRLSTLLPVRATML